MAVYLAYTVCVLYLFLSRCCHGIMTSVPCDGQHTCAPEMCMAGEPLAANWLQVMTVIMDSILAAERAPSLCVIVTHCYCYCRARCAVS